MKSKSRQIILQQLVVKLAVKKEDVTTTFSAAMRQLRNKEPNKVIPFMKAFKKAFDEAADKDLEDLEQVALLEALQSI